MKVIFGTTNKRKKEDLQNIINSINLDVTVLGMDDIGWNQGEIEENGNTIEENSLIKAMAIHSFCQKNGIQYPIITDDAGLFCNALNGKPGIYTARYADDELAENPELPKHQCVIKLLRDLQGESNRTAYYKCAVTFMFSDGKYFQEIGKSEGKISTEIIGELKKPYFYSVFVLDGTDKAFGDVKDKDILNTTYRYTALRLALNRFQRMEKERENER